MKKIFAVLVTLLFVASVFGVAQTMAAPDCSGCNCNEVYYTVSQTSVQVGDTFTASVKLGCLGGLDFDTSPGKFSEMIQYDPSKNLVINTETGWATATFKALRPGTLAISNDCCPNDSITITMTPKSHPMFSFMKILGFGKKK
ncbi:MAG: hypothetical protein AMQ22_01056 [Candidatus Methanofastidiosum methylothiophilum]|uniref:Uncharacterized protein n=1 Tax=Candidatus Methanofastidiosum methylothiophilum TaxID=1705564 RepID=A0A150J4V0_9EURY|nr:MAG: hypothetical protein AMQ22_01056 [Candidatus Methanofastidiosum methylthiophilus]